MNQLFHNYHRHTHYSNVRTMDCCVKPIDYINRIKELGHTHYFTTEHGTSGNVFEAYDLCQEHGLMCVFGMEMYYVDDRFEQDRSNYHLVVIALNKEGYYDINRISSEANKTGFYYKPRIDLELLLSLNPKNVVITTACIAGRLFKSDYEERFLIPVKNHFQDHFFLEVQNHNHPAQANWNNKILETSEKYDIPIIHGCDSHYIYPEQAKDRALLLKGKGMVYGDEDSFVLDYPDYEEILERYEIQGVLTRKQAEKALQNTLIFNEAKDLKLDKHIKMPKMCEDKDRIKTMNDLVLKHWNEEKKNIPQHLMDKYKAEIKKELKIIHETNMADYFILNEKIIDLAVNKYGGVLTQTGRGSAVSFIINKLLKFTNIDRIAAPVPLYPTRFMSTARILQANSLPDIDFNTKDPVPFVEATKEILGQDNIYYMVAYGTMKESAAFRNLCRAYDLPMEEYNEVAKNLDTYKNDHKWSKIIQESEKYIGVIDSIAPSPCSFLILSEPISKEIGLIRVGDEICCCIDGYTSDKWKYLKEDFLTVSVLSLIADTFQMIKKPIPSIQELNILLDDKVWKLYEDGITATLNQVDSDFATQLVKKYKPRSVAELSAFVAAIRPGFASLLHHFLEREKYSTGIGSLDEVLADSFHYMLYQESIMKFLMWCGEPEDHTYDILKKIAKKKFKEDELEDLKTKLIEGFKEKTGTEDGFDSVWQVVEDASRYSFNSAHALSVAYDSIYGAYLKANYPLEYYTVCLNHYQDDIDKTNKLTQELSYFDIKLKTIQFRYSKGSYAMDKENNTIYKGIGSIKYCNSQMAEELYLLKNRQYKNFIELLYDIQNHTSANSKQIKILIVLNFFQEFGLSQKLLNVYEYFEKISKRKTLDPSKLDELEIPIELAYRYSSKHTEKRLSDIDAKGLLSAIENLIPNERISLKQRLDFEMEYLGYVDFKDERLKNIYYIIGYKVYYDKSKPYIDLYDLSTGKIIKTKIKDSKLLIERPISLKNVVKMNEMIQEPKLKKINGKWEKSLTEFNNIIKRYEVLQ